MNRKETIERDTERKNTTTTLVIKILFCYLLLTKVYDTLIQGEPFEVHSFFDTGAFGQILWVSLIVWMLFSSLQLINNHGNKKYALKKVSLVIHILFSAAGLLFLFVLIAFYLDFFLVNVSGFEQGLP